MTASTNFTRLRKALQDKNTVKTAAVPTAPVKSLMERLLGSKGLLLGGATLLGVGALTAPTLNSMGERVRKHFYPTLGERMGLPGTTDDPFIKKLQEEAGKELATGGGEAIRSLINRGLKVPGQLTKGYQGRGVFQQLQQDDDVLSQADPRMVMDAYQTMARFAPTLATDPNAVRTFLRESALYGSGPNVMSVQQIANAERAIADAQEGPRR